MPGGIRMFSAKLWHVPHLELSEKLSISPYFHIPVWGSMENWILHLKCFPPYLCSKMFLQNPKFTCISVYIPCVQRWKYDWCCYAWGSDSHVYAKSGLFKLIRNMTDIWSDDRCMWGKMVRHRTIHIFPCYSHFYWLRWGYNRTQNSPIWLAPSPSPHRHSIMVHRRCRLSSSHRYHWYPPAVGIWVHCLFCSITVGPSTSYPLQPVISCTNPPAFHLTKVDFFWVGNAVCTQAPLSVDPFGRWRAPCTIVYRCNPC